jgi:hypothetical protein
MTANPTPVRKRHPSRRPLEFLHHIAKKTQTEPTPLPCTTKEQPSVKEPKRSKCCYLRRRAAGSPLDTWSHPKPITELLQHQPHTHIPRTPFPVWETRPKLPWPQPPAWDRDSCAAGAEDGGVARSNSLQSDLMTDSFPPDRMDEGESTRVLH